MVMDALALKRLPRILLLMHHFNCLCRPQLVLLLL